MGSTSTLFITASTTGSSSLIIFSAEDTTPILVLMFLSTISAIWSKFIIFIFFIVATLSSTVLGLERSIIRIPFLLDSIAFFTLSYERVATIKKIKMMNLDQIARSEE